MQRIENHTPISRFSSFQRCRTAGSAESRENSGASFECRFLGSGSVSRQSDFSGLNYKNCARPNLNRITVRSRYASLQHVRTTCVRKAVL